MQKLRDIFSKVAPEYERCALFQAEIGDRILLSLDGILPHYILDEGSGSFSCFSTPYPEERLPATKAGSDEGSHEILQPFGLQDEPFEQKNTLRAHILDIGMGTGRLTKELAVRFPEADVFGCDFAEGMVRQSRGKNSFHSLCADACFLPFTNKSFDLVVSNLTYQWVEDLKLAFSEISRILKAEGKFIFTCFGKETLKELSETVSYIFNKPRNSYLNDRRHNLPDKTKIKKCLADCGFKNFNIDSYNFTKNYNDIFDLISWLKKVGANRISRPIFLGKNAWQEMDNFYRQNFSCNSKVYAGFEVIEVRVEK